MSPASAIGPEQFISFGALLKFLRQRAGLSQRALAIAAGYTESHISRLENDQRAPDAAVLAARFVPALGLEMEAAWVNRLLALAGAARAEPAADAAPAPVPTANPPPHNLPAALTAFVGREPELTELSRLMNDPAVRLVTLTGPGGMGKTRLALQAAGEQLASFADGVWFVPLAPVSAAEAVVFALGQTLGLRFAGQDTPLSQVLGHLRGRQLLLVLDNFEHVLPAAALVAEILPAAPGVKALVTSRERLGLYGEWLVDVEGLAVPTGEADVSERRSAVRLFVESGRRAHSGFALSADNQAAVRRICTLTAGMPLALELAAAWLPVLTADEIAQEIERGLGILASTAGALPARHRSLRAVFDQSWAKMTERERSVFSRLAVFRGGFTREAAADVAGAELQDLASLSAKALLRRNADRYELHELLRQYGQEQLEAAGEAGALSGRHLAYYAGVGQRAEAALVGPGEVAAMQELMAELDNIRAALAHAQLHDVAAGLELASALRRFWPRRNLQEGHAWLKRLVELPAPREASAIRAKAMLALADLAFLVSSDVETLRTLGEAALKMYQDLHHEHGLAMALYLLAESGPDISAARLQMEESLRLFRRVGDKAGEADVLWLLGGVGLPQTEPDRARACLETSMALCHELGWTSGLCIRLVSLGNLAMRDGNFDSANAYVEQVRTIASGFEDESVEDHIRYLKAELAFRQGHYDEAEAAYEAGLAHSIELGKSFEAYWTQAQLGHIALAKRQPERARVLLAGALRNFHPGGLENGVIYGCEGLADLAAEREPARAVRLIAWCDHARAMVGDRRSLVEQRVVDRTLATARARLDEAAFASAWAAGQALTMEAAVEDALAVESGAA